MRVKIRIASPDDAKAISRLIREELHTPVSASDTAHGLSQLCVNPRHKIFVACVDDIVVGYLHLCDYDSLLITEPMKSILSLAVGSSYRRIGIGKTLLSRAENYAREHGAYGMRLDAVIPTSEARLFFTACGYTDMPLQKELKKPR